MNILKGFFPILLLLIFLTPSSALDTVDIVSEFEVIGDGMQLTIDVTLTSTEKQVINQPIIFDIISSEVTLYTYVRETDDTGLAKLLINIPEELWDTQLTAEIFTSTIFSPDSFTSEVINVPGSLSEVESSLEEIDDPVGDISSDLLIYIVAGILLLVIIFVATRKIVDKRRSYVPTYELIDVKDVEELLLQVVQNYVYTQLQKVNKQIMRAQQDKYSPKLDPSVLISQGINSNFKGLIKYLASYYYNVPKMNVKDTQYIRALCHSVAHPIKKELHRIYDRKLALFERRSMLEGELKDARLKAKEEETLFGESVETKQKIKKLSTDINRIKLTSLKKDLDKILKGYDAWKGLPSIEAQPDQYIILPENGAKVKICCYQTARLGERYCRCGMAITDELYSMFNN